MAELGVVTRAVVLPLDVSPSEERLLISYCGARRFAYNWVIGLVEDNLAVRRAERAVGVQEAALTPALSWSGQSLGMLWTSVRSEVAPWWREVSMHAFRSGIVDAATALKNWSESQSGKRKGRPVAFPKFKKRGKCVPSVSFVEINHQLSWLHPDRHHVRLMLPRASPDPEVRRRRRQLEWLHTTDSTRRLYKLVESGRATIQKVTVAKRGGRWQASFQVRYQTAPIPKPVRHRGALIALDAGLKHLVTTSERVPGLSDEHGHVPNPRVLESQLRQLRRLDRAVARCQTNSKNRRKLLDRRARLHGRISKTRALCLHPVTTTLAGAYDTVAVEDLNVVGIGNRKRGLGRALADAALGELRRQLVYKTADRSHELVAVGRFFASTRTCSACGAVKAKLPLSERTYRCEVCGVVLDRDVNAARSIAREALRLLAEEDQEDVSGLRPETVNADRRPQKTSPALPGMAAVARTAEPSSPRPQQRTGTWDLDGPPTTAAGSTAQRAGGDSSSPSQPCC